VQELCNQLLPSGPSRGKVGGSEELELGERAARLYELPGLTATCNEAEEMA